MTTVSPQQLELNRRSRFDAWKTRNNSLRSDLADCRVRISNLQRPGAQRDPQTAAWLDTQKDREVECLARLAEHDAMGAALYGNLINPSAEPVALKSGDAAEIDRLNADLNSLRTLVDNLRNENRRLVTKIQSAQRAVGEA